MASAWRLSLRDLVVRLRPLRLDWMLVGSAATAEHGARIEPGDIDVLVRRAEDVHLVANVMPTPETPSSSSDPADWYSSAQQPVLMFDNDRWAFGRWTLAGVRVEVAHIDNPDAEGRLLETVGEEVWRVSSTVDWEGHPLPIVPLEVQLATMVSSRSR